MSSTEIFVAIPVLDLDGGLANETFNIRNDIEQVAQAYAAAINGEGGIACRQLRVKTYKVSPLNPNEQQARCLEIIADKPFAVVDVGAYRTPVARSCFSDAQIPYQNSGVMNEDEANGAYPFMYALASSTDRAARTWVFEAAARGSFNEATGFRKLGLLLDECNPKANAEFEHNLNKVGVDDDQINIFTTSCGATPAPPNQLSQAVVQHRNAGASHVYLAANPVDDQNYVRQADGVRWKPVYLASDVQSVTSGSIQDGWPDGFDGAVAITGRRTGERNSGIEHPVVGRCNEWMRKKNVPPSASETDEATIMLCDQLRLLVAAANAVGPEVTRARLLEGLARVGRFEGGVFGLGIYDRPKKLFGMDHVRAIRWHLDCKCWKVLDPEMKLGRLDP